MVTRLVENDEMRPGKGRKPKQKPRLLAAGKLSHRRVGGFAGKAEPAELRAHARFRRLRHEPAHVRVGTAGAVEFIELMLREVADRKPIGTHHLPGLRCQSAGDELRDGRFAVAVRAEERDAVVAIDAQRQPPQHGFAGSVANGNAVERDDRRGEVFLRRRGMAGPGRRSAGSGGVYQTETRSSATIGGDNSFSGDGISIGRAWSATSAPCGPGLGRSAGPDCAWRAF